ncbi:SDR family oxidoreductase [Agrobacterium rhizogenes]|uniref:Ribitol 2-dehydrogenase n=1 Tax=Rhizobium rhizogenes (strain K84 / ATCC BAA-868) TaxID=311403 RepID=B9JQF0_RHIR8|nr:SDR family oxidoreductase [Rhizobium rhizogenes]ACM31369.1 ribitol 2-dehydrogenase [Rhizobium rhizogenes K84]OCJ17363.1 glucose dehydrogenase [Agrobacterium sp. B131/95]OCJ28505.1 glucose dehydrogenase [Agrobacterium sp. B133/95]NTI46314.1 SDR family oxidoreductase [Rhizobium rhizogenes]NTI52998.1 SDR family oxidoreductase [Rhizobium rhizogenes]
MQHLTGKVAAVTGAASGIGLASTEALIAEGATVVLVDRDEKALGAVCARLGERAVPLTLDLLNPEKCAGLLDGILSKAGKLDIFHANAGTYIGGDLVDANLDAIDRMLNLNVNVVMKNVRSVIPHMIERGSGDIIITSSVAGHTAVPWEPVYSASKWAMTSFTQTMRRQLLKSGIRVGSISPGPVVSALLADWPEENLRKAKEAGALIEPKEVADAVVFMLTRPRNVTIRDIVILPSSFDI